MLLQRLVETSRNIAATSKRKQKIELLANLLRTAGPGELEPAVAFLSGTTRHGRIGIGYAALHAARVSTQPALDPTLTIADVEHTLDNFATVKGAGSDTRKRELLGGLFARATADEQDF